MSPRTLRLFAVLLVLLAAAGGFTAGYVLHPPSATSSGSQILRVVAAGSLSSLLPPIASQFANATPGVSAPAASETFTGSLAALSDIASLGQTYDAAIVADYRLIPQMLEPAFAHWELLFASDPVVLAYDPAGSGLSGLNSSNWGAKLVTAGGLLGIANASTDPLGYAEIFTLQLQGLLVDGNASSLYAHFYAGAVGAYASPRASATRLAPESQAAVLLAEHEVAAYLVYRSYALTSHLTYLTLDPRVDLGSTNGTALAEYARASTTILASSGSEVVHGTPVLFSVTVPSNAPDASLGDLFVAYLVSPALGPQLSADGFLPLSPVWVDEPSELPAVLSADTAPLPPGFPLAG
jgi:molybdate/tungstate transport system substrate-binding protein